MRKEAAQAANRRRESVRAVGRFTPDCPNNLKVLKMQLKLQRLRRQSLQVDLRCRWAASRRFGNADSLRLIERRFAPGDRETSAHMRNADSDEVAPERDSAAMCSAGVGEVGRLYMSLEPRNTEPDELSPENNSQCNSNDQAAIVLVIARREYAYRE